jgi:MarR family transcriptional regulator, organic hydroperoxide resistance regulator
VPTASAPGAAPAVQDGPAEQATDLLALDRQVCFALAVASRNVIALYRPLLEPMGLTHPQYLVMLALWEEEPLRVSELARRISLEPATLSPLLKRLEASGMVTRTRDPLDERALAIALTTKGRRARSRAEKIPPAIMERLGMGLAELQGLRDGLTRLIDAARGTDDSPRTEDAGATDAARGIVDARPTDDFPTRQRSART